MDLLPQPARTLFEGANAGLRKSGPMKMGRGLCHQAREIRMLRGSSPISMAHLM
jgi:hypothetical protein